MQENGDQLLTFTFLLAYDNIIDIKFSSKAHYITHFYRKSKIISESNLCSSECIRYCRAHRSYIAQEPRSTQ